MWEDEEKLTLEERRKRYHCWKFATADQIKTWHEISQLLKLDPLIKPLFEVKEDLNKKIGYFHGDSNNCMSVPDIFGK